MHYHFLLHLGCIWQTAPESACQLTKRIHQASIPFCRTPAYILPFCLLECRFTAQPHKSFLKCRLQRERRAPDLHYRGPPDVTLGL